MELPFGYRLADSTDWHKGRTANVSAFEMLLLANDGRPTLLEL